MAYQEQEFKEYKIIHWNNYGKEEIRIECYLSRGMVGILHFLDDHSSYNPRFLDRVIHLYYGLDKFSDIVTTLRYEKPLYIFFNDNDNTPFGGIKTSPEPVGEEEG